MSAQDIAGGKSPLTQIDKSSLCRWRLHHGTVIQSRASHKKILIFKIFNRLLPPFPGWTGSRLKWTAVSADLEVLGGPQPGCQQLQTSSHLAARVICQKMPWLESGLATLLLSSSLTWCLAPEQKLPWLPRRWRFRRQDFESKWHKSGKQYYQKTSFQHGFPTHWDTDTGKVLMDGWKDGWMMMMHVSMDG